MPKPDSAPVPDAQVDAAVAELDRHLRRLRIGRNDRQALVEEVRGDLQTAAADGMNPAILIGPDFDTFATNAVEAAGYRPPPHDYQRVVAGGALACIVAVVAAYLLIVEVLTPALASVFDLDGRYPTAGPAVAYAGIALTSLLATLAALRIVLAGRPAVRETLTRAALLVPVAAAAGLSAALALHRQPDYAATERWIYLQVLCVALPVLAALALSRWWAVHTCPHTEESVQRTSTCV